MYLCPHCNKVECLADLHRPDLLEHIRKNRSLYAAPPSVSVSRRDEIYRQTRKSIYRYYSVTLQNIRGRGNHVPLPDCVYDLIHAWFPDSNNIRVWFQAWSDAAKKRASDEIDAFIYGDFE